MKLTDGKRTVEIRMMVWTGTAYGPDWSDDFFFDVAALTPCVEGSDIHIVPDVDYYIEQAQRWSNLCGDYVDWPSEADAHYVEVSDMHID